MAVVAALLVGSLVLAFAPGGDRIRAATSFQICRIVALAGGGGGCTPPDGNGGPDGGGPGTDGSGWPTWQDPERTPEEAATSGDYVALGDSFSSGEGGSDYEDGTDEDREAEEELFYQQQEQGPTYPYPPITEDPYSNMCHRSTGAYGQQVADEFDFGGEFTFRACSGAVINDFYETRSDRFPDEPWKGNDDEAAQQDYVDEDTTLITFSIGGNDAHFAEILKGCIGAGLNPFDTCSDDDEREEVHEAIGDVGPRLVELLRRMREQAPNARIIVVGYPRFFPTENLGEWSDGTQIDDEDKQFINEETRYMNEVMQAAIDEVGGPGAGFEFVNVYDAFEGCEIGTDDPCMNNLQNGFGDGKPVDNGSYHPNDLGHDRLADLVNAQIREGD